MGNYSGFEKFGSVCNTTVESIETQLDSLTFPEDRSEAESSFIDPVNSGSGAELPLCDELNPVLTETVDDFVEVEPAAVESNSDIPLFHEGTFEYIYLEIFHEFDGQTEDEDTSMP